MKDEVLRGLLTARILFESARLHCFVRDRHVASAGLVVLQDALELVLYSSLLEIGADEQKAIEQFSFDELIGELRRRQLPITKSGTLKAMNKQRVLIKHHAQLAEPAAVQHYYHASILAADALLQHVVGKPLGQIVIADAITKPDLQQHITDAIAAIQTRHYFDAMIAIRKALFLAVETEYDIRGWAEHDPGNLMPPALFGKNKAPIHTRNRKWIRENVTKLTDYVQLDHDRLRSELLSIGIDPEEFFNVWRLTPRVYWHLDYGWAITRGPEDEAAATEDNARYCLDVVVSIIRNQESHKDIIRTSPYRRWRARLLRDEVLLTRAARDANSGRSLHTGETYHATAIVTGEADGEYVQIFHYQQEPLQYFDGYLPRAACDIEEY